MYELYRKADFKQMITIKRPREVSNTSFRKWWLIFLVAVVVRSQIFYLYEFVQELWFDFQGSLCSRVFGFVFI